MAGIGHNNGPAMERGHTWRSYQWRRAQQKLMPNTIPLMIVRMRVKRAAELGLDYKTYASIRQTSGQDIMGLLFSSNALRIMANGAMMPEDRNRALEAIKSAQKLSLVHRPVRPEDALAANPVIDATEAAPLFTDSWSDMRARLQSFMRARRLPGNQVLVIGDAPLEDSWTAAAKAGGYVSADQYFDQRAG